MVFWTTGTVLAMSGSHERDTQQAALQSPSAGRTTVLLRMLASSSLSERVFHCRARNRLQCGHPLRNATHKFGLGGRVAMARLDRNPQPFDRLVDGRPAQP